MPVIEVIAALLGIIVAILTISKILSGEEKPQPKTIEGIVRATTLSPVSGPTSTPLTHAAFAQQASSMPVEWVTYEGTNPPLKLKIRGATEAMYRQLFQKAVKAIGEETFGRMTGEQQHAVTCSINAELYVLDWDGAHYANGNKIPFSAPSLELMLQKDPDLEAFLRGQAQRISPIWDA